MLWIAKAGKKSFKWNPLVAHQFTTKDDEVGGEN